MACCLMAPSHYLSQCWLIISKVLWHSSGGNFIKWYLSHHSLVAFIWGQFHKEIPQPPFTKLSLKIAHLKLNWNLPGANELIPDISRSWWLLWFQGVVNLACVSLAVGYPTVASVPHTVVNGFKNLLAIAAVTDIEFKEAETVSPLTQSSNENWDTVTSTLDRTSEDHFSIKMPSYMYRNSHNKDTIGRLYDHLTLVIEIPILRKTCLNV